MVLKKVITVQATGKKNQTIKVCVICLDGNNYINSVPSATSVDQLNLPGLCCLRNFENDLFHISLFMCRLSNLFHPLELNKLFLSLCFY